MSGHFICEYCGHEDPHADYCQELRPPEDRWLGNRTPKEMQELQRRSLISWDMEYGDFGSL